jgi:hypothetical protein
MEKYQNENSIKVDKVKADPNSQNVILTEGMPLIGSKNNAKFQVVNNEQYTLYKINGDKSWTYHLTDDKQWEAKKDNGSFVNIKDKLSPENYTLALKTLESAKKQ